RNPPQVRDLRLAMKIAIVVETKSGPGILHQLTGAIARHNGNITTVHIISEAAPNDRVYFEIEPDGEPDPLLAELGGLEVVLSVERVNTLEKIYGKRVIIVGGGAQVGQVAIGAIMEADRHNIRGEHISVDTIPLVGEQPLADAV